MWLLSASRAATRSWTVGLVLRVQRGVVLKQSNNDISLTFHVDCDMDTGHSTTTHTTPVCCAYKVEKNSSNASASMMTNSSSLTGTS